jgi:hypothetical protein
VGEPDELKATGATPAVLDPPAAPPGREGPPLLIATHFTQKSFRSDNRNEAQIGFSADNRQAGRRY